MLQCEDLIAGAHKIDTNGQPFLRPIDKQQITVAAFLNMFIAWEAFLEESLIKFMTGSPTTNGTYPIRHVTPPDPDNAHAIVVGVMRYFDYGNHQNFIKIANTYFQNGYPFKEPLNAIYSELEDLRTMRNSSAHISSSTQKALDALAARLLSRPGTSLTLYQLLISVSPSLPPGVTILETYKQKLAIAAGLIVQG